MADFRIYAPGPYAGVNLPSPHCSESHRMIFLEVKNRVQVHGKVEEFVKIVNPFIPPFPDP